MNTISHSELVRLATAENDQVVSLYMPAHQPGHELSENPIEFKNLLMSAADSLRSGGMSPSHLHDFFAPAIQLLDQHLFWNSLSRSLVVFISTQGLQIWHLPFDCDELCVVGKRYHIVPLAAWLNEDAQYYVLAVSQNRLRLLHGTRFIVQEVKVPNLPTNQTQALHYDPREGFFQTHSAQPQIRGKESIVFTGQGGEVDVAKDELAAYFRLVDAAVHKFLHERTEPLIFAGVDYLFPIFREHNHYPHLFPTHLAGNPDLVADGQLRDRAWPLIETLIRRRQDTEVTNYWRLLNQARASNHISEVIMAANSGAIEILFINPSIRRFGIYEPVKNAVRIDEQPESDNEDLVNLAVCLVLQNGGKVEALPNGNIPGGGSMAAIFRYVPAQT
jgi:hypothetical protein